MDFSEFTKLSYRQLKSLFIQNLKNYYGNSEAQSVFNYWILERHEWKLKDWILNADNTLKNPEILWKDYQKLLQKMPVQYVVEKAYFYNLPFYVNPAVLIPRPETEILVHEIINRYKPHEKINILDICSGSGCIAIALKKELIEANIQAIEISYDAIQVAMQNAHFHKVDINWIHQNIFDFSIKDFNNLDVIVSNPPYIPSSEKPELMEHVINYEPSIALFSEENPLKFYEKISELAFYWLKKNGLLILEVHFQYAHQVKNILQKWNFHDTQIVKDYFGKERMVFGYR